MRLHPIRSTVSLTLWTSILGLFLFDGAIGPSALSAQWRLVKDSVGEGAPAFLATVDSEDRSVSFFIEYSTEEACIPSLALKNLRSTPFPYRKDRSMDRALISFPSTQQHSLEAHPGSPSVYFFYYRTRKELELLFFNFQREPHFELSIRTAEGKTFLKNSFGLKEASEVIPRAGQDCEKTYLERQDFLLPDSSQRPLEKTELEMLSAPLLEIARNEILARKGFIFQSKSLARHFAKKKWYRPRSSNPTLTPIERANIELIQAMEAERRKSPQGPQAR